MHPSRRRSRPKTFVWVFASTLLAAFLILFAFFGQESIDAKNWPTTEGRVIVSEVKVGCGRGGNQHYPDIRYTYHYGGRSREGKSVAVETDLCGWAATAKEVVAKYPVGRLVTVHVDPNYPSRAALEAGGLQSPTSSLILVLAVGLVASIARIVWLLRGAA